ncbi:MAG: DUF3455 domain-containing protein [Burkholderiales bacterium]|nr:DUF3455 domain-containing protein [Burkholderiales bacterium]
MKPRNSMPYLAAAATLAACVSEPTLIPDTLDPGPKEMLAMVVPAKGVQIYECRAKKDASSFEWAFVAPDAELFDARGHLIGRHGAGPYWEANDGSRVVGTLKARAEAPIAGSIPWLLLATKGTGTAGSFSKVTSIQRVNTSGGMPPSSPCTADLLGRKARVDYVATYRFFVAN